MAAIKNGVLKLLFNSNKLILSNYNRRVDAFLPITRNIQFFKINSLKPDHNEVPYEYEETNDPNDWKYVERLLPVETVPEIKSKPVYPSGWRPQTADPTQYPYFIERSKNHMLPVYLRTFKVHGQQKQPFPDGQKITKLVRVRGDIWALFNELREHIETIENRKIPCFVHESNSQIHFKGDFVYYIEQWLLARGF